jgi:hypothetical protein
MDRKRATPTSFCARVDRSLRQGLLEKASITQAHSSPPRSDLARSRAQQCREDCPISLSPPIGRTSSSLVPDRAGNILLVQQLPLRLCKVPRSLQRRARRLEAGALGRAWGPSCGAGRWVPCSGISSSRQLRQSAKRGRPAPLWTAEVSMRVKRTQSDSMVVNKATHLGRAHPPCVRMGGVNQDVVFLVNDYRRNSQQCGLASSQPSGAS